MGELVGERLNTTIFGVRAQQSWGDLLMWERLFRMYGSQVRTLVEVGSGYGGMSLFLALHCFQNGIRFVTLDQTVPLAQRTPLGRELEDCFRQGDVLAEQFLANVLSEHRAAGPMLVFCDNGNKPREFELIQDSLLPGDLVVVHDWGTEFTEVDWARVDPGQHGGNVPPLFQRILTGEDDSVIGSMTLFLKRI